MRRIGNYGAVKRERPPRVLVTSKLYNLIFSGLKIITMVTILEIYAFGKWAWLQVAFYYTGMMNDEVRANIGSREILQLGFPSFSKRKLLFFLPIPEGNYLSSIIGTFLYGGGPFILYLVP